jgi:hypothetical protein
MTYFVLSHAQARQNAIEAVKTAPDGWTVQVKAKTRSLEQNAKLWACLHDVAAQVVWHGRKLSPEDWKHIFSASLKKQDVVMGIDNQIVVLGQSTSKMTVKELSDLVEIIHAFGANHDVKFGNDSR